MKLTRLRLVGFKSFVDASEFVIEPGLTGVVGPNGCGKSNLVEGLRWVMGESSYKALRAAEMDDVIFAGSSARPSRNTAEVVVTLDNRLGLAPAPFAAVDTLEVSRRIEREKGSTYRINGREVRARDVQLLFADASTGARSPSLVRQGQIAEIIAAKPEARRRVLEEAAGIAGLHQRRHEAELRLRTAEQNLVRVDDTLNRMRSQLDGLKRQARQAVRYRALSTDIRALEAAVLGRAQAEAAAEHTAATQALAEAERLVAQRLQAQGEAARAEAVAEHEMPALREASIAAAAAVERLRRAAEELDREERRARERSADLGRQLVQIGEDVAREKTLAADAADNLVRLDAEAALLREEEAGSSEREREVSQRVEATGSALAAAEAALAEATALLATRTAERDALVQARDQAAARLARLDAELQRLANEAAALEASVDAGLLPRCAAEVEAAEAGLAATEAEAAGAEAALFAARDAEAAARTLAAEAEAEMRRFEVEARTLVKLLDDGTSKFPPALDSLRVDVGFETALGAALGDDLSAALDEAAPVHWRTLGGEPGPDLPPGAEPLAAHVAAPPALARRLAQIGLVDQADGARLQAGLKTGQRLVSREGSVWRWDGLVRAAEAPSAAARRLAERNRLADVERALKAALERHGQRRGEAEEKAQAASAAAAHERAAREAVRTARGRLETARQQFANAEREAARVESRRAALAEARTRMDADVAESAARRGEAEAALAALPPHADLSENRDRLRGEAERARERSSDARAAAGALNREREARSRRLEALEREKESWQGRAGGVDERLEHLESRRQAALEERTALEAVPEQVAAQRRALLSSLSEAEMQAREASDVLAVGENRRNAAQAAAREALKLMSEAREALAREETRRDAAAIRLDEARQRLVDAVGPNPDLVALAKHAEELAGSRLAEELERLRGDRERLGAVNLRADDEVNEVQSAHDGLLAEQEDLNEAIRQLRQGIQSLNREGRERLGAAFEVVNGHFKRLFTTLFGGGEASLELIESDDPLQAGLEVVARPPGKKPQTLSLLSGGEQALTAMALIFAIFLTNPAPICVLDEVDAPLDDANVERFCDLLIAMRQETDTRFLVVTHNPVTMSRMDRLFGVTMAERGVSQLVSVDLEAAERMREAG